MLSFVVTAKVDDFVQFHGLCQLHYRIGNEGNLTDRPTGFIGFFCCLSTILAFHKIILETSDFNAKEFP